MTGRVFTTVNIFDIIFFILVACGGVLKSRNGTITSPSYPDKYPDNKRCIWTIRAPPLHQIKLSFQDFEVENSGVSFSINTENE